MRAMKKKWNPVHHTVIYIVTGSQKAESLSVKVEALNSMDINEPALKLKNGLLILSTQN